jgi:RNA-binding, Nab2-type zinc finger
LKPLTRNTPSSMNTLCVHFARGACRYGSDCRKSHEIAHRPSSPADLPWRRSSSQSPSPPSFPRFSSFASSRPRTPCRYFDRGGCRDGDACIFSHSHSPEQTGSQVTVSDPSPPKNITEVDFQNHTLSPNYKTPAKRKPYATMERAVPKAIKPHSVPFRGAILFELPHIPTGSESEVEFWWRSPCFCRL